MPRLLLLLMTWLLGTVVHGQAYARELGATLISHRNDAFQYGRIPSDQFSSTIALGAQVTNTGTEPQTNLVLTMGVTAPGPANTFSLDQAHPLLDPGASLDLEQMSAISGMEEGNYAVAYSISTDQDAFEVNTANDSITRHFRVDNNWFTLDGFGVHSSADLDTTSIGTDSFTGGENHVTCLTKYHVTSPLHVLGLEVLLGNGTAPGSYMIGALYDTIGVLVGDLSQPLWESNPEDVGAEQLLWGWRYIQLDDPYVLSAGAYYAAATLYSDGGASPLRIMDDRTVVQPADASLVHVPGSGTLTDGNAFAIRLHVVMLTSLDERANHTDPAFHPNPTEGIVTFRSGDQRPCSMEVLDHTGRSVFQGIVTDGAIFDLRGYAKGMYVAHMTVENSSSYQRLVLE